MQVLLLVVPVPQRDNDVPFDTLRPRRFGKWQFALGDPVNPIAVVFKRQVAEPGQLAEHHLACLPRLHTAAPRLDRGRERPERCGDGARGQLTQLVAPDAAGVFHGAQPCRLIQSGRDRAVAAELVGAGDLQHRVPIDRGVVVRSRCFVRRHCCGDAETLPRLGRHLGAVNQPVAARPDRIIGRRQIRHDEAAPIVGHDTLDVADGQIAGFRDDPDARFRTIRAGDRTADIVVIDGNVVRRLLRL